MATKRTRSHSAPAKQKGPNKNAPTNGKPVALTLKVDQDTYIRLCTLGATQRRTNQDILTEALQQHLKRLGV